MNLVISYFLDICIFLLFERVLIFRENMNSYFVIWKNIENEILRFIDKH